MIMPEEKMPRPEILKTWQVIEVVPNWQWIFIHKHSKVRLNLKVDGRYAELIMTWHRKRVGTQHVRVVNAFLKMLNYHSKLIYTRDYKSNRVIYALLNSNTYYELEPLPLNHLFKTLLFVSGGSVHRLRVLAKAIQRANGGVS